jgi:hypothetical protein
MSDLAAYFSLINLLYAFTFGKPIARKEIRENTAINKRCFQKEYFLAGMCLITALYI